MKNRLCIIFLTFCFIACSPRALHEAEEVVRTADSLRTAGQMYGIDTGDSATLAQAYETLSPFVHRTLSPRTYSHACYHYGRLLREKKNPVAAMECFINASHTRTRDYHILGRVYSNMGDICHLAGEFQRAYEMYERSANCFLRNGDTLNYYYALNDMAFELAEQGKKEETNSLLLQIKGSEHSHICALKTLTIAKAYAENNQYDSVLQVLKQSPCYYALHYVLKANAFWHIEQMDSALYYAKKVMTLPDATEQNKYNMLYIILNYDSTLQNEDIIALSAQSSVFETDILIPLHNQWAMAVQLLEQDIARKPDLRWLYTLIAVLLFVCSSFIFVHVWRKRKLHQQISEEIEIKQNQIDTLSQRQEEHRHQLLEEMEAVCTNLRESDNWKKELCWNNYSEMCKIVNLRFYDFVTCLRPFCLSEKEIRLCILILLKASTKQMVDNIPYSKSGLGKFKLTTAQKLGTTTREMRAFLLNLLS